MLEDKEQIQDDINNFASLVETAKQLLLDKVPVFQRNTLIRCAGRDLGLPLNDQAIFGIIGKARRELEGTQNGYSPNEKIKIPKTSWLWEHLIAEGNITQVVSLPKLGKSSLMGAFLGAMVVTFLPSGISFTRDAFFSDFHIIPGIESGIFGMILIAVILFEPMGLYGRWLKIKAYFELFPFYRKDMFRRQKTYLKTERTR